MIPGTSEFIDHNARQWHLADDAAFPALQCRNDCDAAIEVNGCRCERQDFRNPASTQVQDEAKELYFQGSAMGSLGEAPSLGGVEILTAAS